VSSVQRRSRTPPRQTGASRPWAIEALSPQLLNTNLELVYASDRAVPDDFDLWRASRASVGSAFAAAVPIPELASPARDDDPWLSADARYIIFSSDRSGNRELWEAFRF
jgi:WD40-like Beta Propeller Repeat